MSWIFLYYQAYAKILPKTRVKSQGNTFCMVQPCFLFIHQYYKYFLSPLFPSNRGIIATYSSHRNAYPVLSELMGVPWMQHEMVSLCTGQTIGRAGILDYLRQWGVNCTAAERGGITTARA
ncbi:MAG TPA: hypothetical protein VEI57_10910 [Nitrospirota bacterium]|nr:hypothetical protein [Nitrospirota bacterium]